MSVNDIDVAIWLDIDDDFNISSACVSYVCCGEIVSFQPNNEILNGDHSYNFVCEVCNQNHKGTVYPEDIFLV